MTAQDKLLDRIRKLHAKAESAKHMGSMEEAQSFAAKVQEMLLKNRLEMSDLEMTEMEASEPIEEHVVSPDPTDTLKAKNKRVAWVERLAGIVAEAHFCKILVMRGSVYIWLVGRKSDREVAQWVIQWLTPYLWKLSHREMMLARKREKAAGRYYGARGFRAEFIAGFLDRLRERYRAERGHVVEEMKQLAAQSSAGSQIGTALVRLDTADKQVAAYVDQKYKRKASAVRMTRTSNRSGYDAGRAAADKVDLNRRGLGEGSSSKYLNG
jgi:hypothetical protein